jgi:hypothetical protein
MILSSRLEAEHPSNLARRLTLREAEEVCGETDDIPAFVAACKVSPPAGAHVYLKRAEVVIHTTRIARGPFRTGPLAIGNPAMEQDWQIC